MWKKIIQIGLVLMLVILLVGGYYFFSRQTEKAQASFQELETETIQEGYLELSISAIGKVRSKQSTVLSWETSGIVESVKFDEGDQVNTGEKLATLMQTSLPQEIILAQSNLEDYLTAQEELTTSAKNAKTKAVAEISQYTNAVRDAQYQLDNFTVPSNQVGMDTQEALDVMGQNLDKAREAFEPYKYYPSGDATREELKEALDEAQADYNSAVKRLQYETELEVAQSNLQKALQDYEKWKNGPTAGEIAAAEARVASAQAALRKAWIEAPFDGIVSLTIPQAGDQVNPNTTAFRIDDLSTLYIDVEISEVDINKVEIGQDVNISLDALHNKEYSGKVIEIGSIGSDQSGVVIFSVTIQIMNSDEDVLPGMTAEVDIVIDRNEISLLIPNQAIRKNVNGNLIVYVLEAEGKMKEVEINLGESSDIQSEVTNNDLQVGDKVILNPPTDEEDTPQFMGPFGSSRIQNSSAPNTPEMGGN